MPATPAANWFVLAFLAMVLVLLAFNKDTAIALSVAPVWVAIMVVSYFASRSHHVRLPASRAPGTAPGIPYTITNRTNHASREVPRCGSES